MNDGIIAFDLKGNLIHFNREAKNFLTASILTILDLTVSLKKSMQTSRLAICFI